VFEVSQRTQDLHILSLINAYFKMGNVYIDTKGISIYKLRIKNRILSTLIFYFNNYPLVGYKALQYSILIKIVNFLNNQVKTEQRDIEAEKLIK
jgi:LAGLIDADG endonuclease